MRYLRVLEVFVIAAFVVVFSADAFAQRCDPESGRPLPARCLTPGTSPSVTPVSVEQQTARPEDVIINLATPDLTADEFSNNYYFDLAIVGGCGSPFYQSARQFLDSRNPSFWQRLTNRTGITYERASYVLTAKFSNARWAALPANTLAEAPLVSFTRNANGSVVDVRCESLLLTGIPITTDLSVAFKLYVSREPVVSDRAIRGLAFVTKVASFLVSTGVFHASMQADLAIIDQNREPLATAANEFFHTFQAVDDFKVERTILSSQAGLLSGTGTRVMGLKKTLRTLAFLDTVRSGRLARPNENIANAIRIRTGVDIVNLATSIQPEYDRDLVEGTTSTARRICQRIRDKFDFNNSVDNVVAMYAILNGKRTTLNGQAKFHCLDATDIEDLSRIGITRPPYEGGFAGAAAVTATQVAASPM